MKDITVDKNVLLEALRKNREEHRQIFLEALDGFAKEVQAELERNLELLRQGKRRNVYIQRPVPTDHTRDYDSAIGMIEMSIGDTFVLSEEDYRSYVRDEWDWVRQFSSVSNTYSALSRRKFGDEEN